MLDEDEFARVSKLYQECMLFAKESRAKALSLAASSIDQILEPVRLEYERLTGFANCNAHAVMHHRLLRFGPPCTACGKLLRTSEARHCAECGAARATPS